MLDHSKILTEFSEIYQTQIPSVSHTNLEVYKHSEFWQRRKIEPNLMNMKTETSAWFYWTYQTFLLYKLNK